MVIRKDLFGIDETRARFVGWMRNAIGDWVRDPNFRSPNAPERYVKNEIGHVLYFGMPPDPERIAREQAAIAEKSGRENRARWEARRKELRERHRAAFVAKERRQDVKSGKMIR